MGLCDSVPGDLSRLPGRRKDVRTGWLASLVVLAVVVAAAALISCSSGDNRVGRESDVFHNGSAGISLTVPDGWYVASRRLTGLLDPRERLVLTSFPIEGNIRSRGCSPDGLLRQLPHSGVAALLLEYMNAGARRHFYRRPDRFHLGPRPTEGFDCFSPQPTGTAHLFNFSESGRAFQLLVAVGRNASPETRHTAERALNSIRVEQCDLPLPSETHPACRRPLPH
jgi:hypothetical protein